MATYPKPGRGAWRTLGGLLPGRPGTTSRVGYYRKAAEGETPIGAAWFNREDLSHHAECVFLGVRALQALTGATVDGWFGPQTAVDVTSAQKRWGLEADGIVGPKTMRTALAGLVSDTCSATGVPQDVLGGILTHESALDPAAVGTNGMDHGLAQINLGAHSATVTLLEAMDPNFAVHWTAEDLSLVYRTWNGRTKADAWDIAIAHHNSPLLAKKWAISGTAPTVSGREFQIEEYVRAVREAW